MPSPVVSETHDNARGSMDVEAPISVPRVVITGKKGMGKSTIAQYLLNSLLNKYVQASA
jgi:polynucleotide 5'-kinase involved in rRNA processing